MIPIYVNDNITATRRFLLEVLENGTNKIVLFFNLFNLWSRDHVIDDSLNGATV